MDLKAPLLAIVLFVAVTYATQVNYGFTPGKEYVYRVKSRLMSGQPELKQQYAGLEIKHKLVIQVQQQDVLLIKVTDTNIGELNEVILGNWWNTKIPESSSVSSETKRMLETPFVVKMKDGQVEYIKVEENEVHFIRNFKKAIVSTLQLDNRAILPAQLTRVDNKIVKTMEETIQGECEVVYEKHLIPEHITEIQQAERVPILEACKDSPVWEVTKTTNFTNCRTMPIYNTITPKGADKCMPGDNTCKLYWERTYQSRFVLCGTAEHGLIQSIDAEEEFIVNPFGYKTEKLVGGTQTNMTLRDIRPIQQRLHVPQQLMTIQSLEMKNPIFRHQQRTDSYRSQDDFEYGRYMRFDEDSSLDNEEEQFEGRRRHQQQYPSLYDNSELYNTKYEQESRRFARNIDDSEEETRQYGKWGQTQQYGKYGQSSSRNYWSRLFNPRREIDSEFETESRYPTSFSQKYDREDRIVKSGMYPYPSLTKPLLFVHPKRINFQEVINTIPEQVQEIARILEHPSNLAQKNILDKIVSVATKLELLSLEQLHKVYEMTIVKAHQMSSTSTTSSHKNYNEEKYTQKTVKNIFLDCLAMSGTNPAIVLIKQLIKKEEIRGEQAAQLIMTIPKYAKTPTKELIDEIFDLATSQTGEHKEQIKTTALLAFSQLVNQACVSPRSQITRYPVEIFGKFCHEDSTLINKYIQYLTQKLQSTQDEYKKSVYIHALGNIGHKNIIQALKPIINNDIKSTADVRSQAIQALKKLVEPESFYRKHERSLVKHVTQFLVSVVLDPTIHYQVRMSAFEIFTVADAPLVYWQKIALRTWFEPSTQVAAYIRSTLKSFTKLDTKIQHFRNLEKKAKQVLHLTKPIKEGIQHSYNNIVSHFMEEMELGYIQQISTYLAKDSIVPETIKFSAIHQMGGFNVKPLEAVLKTRNIREVVEKLLHQHVFFPLSRQGGYNSQLDKIREILNVEPRKAKGPLEGSLFVRLFEEIQRMYPVNHESLTDLIRKVVEEYPRLENGIPVNYQKTLKLVDTTILLPTQIGVPYILKVRVPALLSLKGHIKIQTQPELQSRVGVPQKVKIVFDLNPVWTWKVVATSGFTTYSNLKTYATGVEKKFTFHLPGAIVVRADLKEKTLALTHVLPETHKVQNPSDVEIMTYKVKPFTTIYNLKKMAQITHTDNLKTIKITEEPKKVNKHIGYKYLGLAAKLEQTTDGELEDVNDILKKAFQHRPTTLAHFWSASKTNKQRKYRLTLDLLQSQTKETTILFDFDKIVKSVASVESSELRSGRRLSLSNIDDEEQQMSLRHQSGKPFFARQSIYEQNQDQETERFHGLKNEYSLDSEDEYTPSTFSSGRHQQQEERLITKFEGKHETELERHAINKILSEITSGYIYKVKVALMTRGVEKRDFAANLIVAMNPSNNIKKVQILLERSPLGHQEPRPFKIVIDAETKFPHVPIADFAIAQSMDMTSFVKAKIFAGHQIQRESAAIRIEGVMKRNEEVKQYLDTLKKVAECEKVQQHGFRLHPTCVNATTIASMLNEYHFNIEYQHVPAELRNMTYHIEDLITAIWYPYMSTNHGDVQNQHGKVQVAIKVHPIQKNFDLKIKKPTATIVFNKVPLDTQKQTLFPINAKKSIVARTFNKILGGYYNTKCLMGKQNVATFDKVVYEAKLKSEAFHLLTKDCSGLYKFAVLVKQHAESKKIVRVIVKNTVVQTMPGSSRMFSTNGLRVLVNGQEQVLPVDKIVEITEQGKTVIRLIAKQNGVVEIRAPKHGFVVLTNGEQVIVKASNTLRSKLCGLCGDFNGEKTADLKTPEKCIESPREPRDFVRSYAIESSTQERSLEGRHHGQKSQNSFYSKYFGTPVSYLSGYFSGRQQNNYDDNEEQQNDFDDEITFGRRSVYTRNQCVRELDDSSRQGKQFKQQNSLIGGGDHDMRRSWEQNQYNKYDNEYNQEYDNEYTNKYNNEYTNKYNNKYDNEYDQEYDNEDVFEKMWQNREHRRRFQDQDDFENEDRFYKNYDSSIFNQDSLFENDFERRNFGKWDREDKFDQEQDFEQDIYGNKKWEIEGRRHFNQEQDSDEEYNSENKSYGRQYNKYNNQYKYDQDLESTIDSEEMINNKRRYNNEYLRSQDSDEEKEFSGKKYYNNDDIEDYEQTIDDDEEYQQDKYERRQQYGSYKSNKRCTVLKHKIVERNGKQCFSIRPRVQCNKHTSEECKPVQHQTKTVKFYCAQTPLEARYLEAKVQRQSTVQQLLQKPVHFTEQLELPTQCTVATGRSF